MEHNYIKGDKITMSDDAVEGYGEKYRGVVYTVLAGYTNSQEHPGFDSSAGSALYDFEEIEFSLYEWEMVNT